MNGRSLALWGAVFACAFALLVLVRRTPSGPGGGQPVVVGGPRAVDGARGRSLGVYLAAVEGGLRVDSVVPGGAADVAGIDSNDVLVAIDGQPVEDPAQVREALQALRPGDALTLTVLRDGQPLGEGGVLRLTEDAFREGAYALSLARRLITAGARQLLAARRPDGLWPHYQDPDRPSVGTTALAAYALARAGAEGGDAGSAALAQAVDLLLDYRSFADGGLEDPALVVPHRVYATALLVLARRLRGASSAEVGELTAWLGGAQVHERQGYDPIDSRYGAWSYYDGYRSEALRTDVSTARYALQALDAAGLARDHPVWERAGLYLQAVQNQSLVTAPEDRDHLAERRARDGGFGFTPRNSKAGQDLVGDALIVWRSYGSATADGLLGLLAVRGIDHRSRADAPLPEDPQIQAALRWLARRYTLVENPGFGDDPVGWGQGLVFYYLAALAEAFHRAGVQAVVEPGGRRRLWAEELALQLGDLHGRKGYRFQSESGLMHEDEPVIAASFAVVALAAARDRLLAGGGSELRAGPAPTLAPADVVAGPPPAADAVTRGARAFVDRGCVSCHQDGVAQNAPSLVGVGDRLLARLRTDERARAHLRAFLRDPRPEAALLFAPEAYPARMPALSPEALDDPGLDDLASFLLSRTGRRPVSAAQ